MTNWAKRAWNVLSSTLLQGASFLLSQCNNISSPLAVLDSVDIWITTNVLLDTVAVETENVKWHTHAKHEMAHQLWKSTNDLICFYCTVIHPVIEYASPVWHSSLNVPQSDIRESLQKRAMNIILPGYDYKTLLTINQSINQSSLIQTYEVYRTTQLQMYNKKW